MYRLPSLPALLVEKEIIDVRTAQFLSEWQSQIDRDACPIAIQHLAAIVEHIRVLPRDQLVRYTADRILDELIADIRHRQILDLRYNVSHLRLQDYAERLAKLAVPQPVRAQPTERGRAQACASSCSTAKRNDNDKKA